MWKFMNNNNNNNHILSARQLELVIFSKKWTCQIVNVAVPADHGKFERCQKQDKYLDLWREFKKKLWNVKVTVIPIVIDALGKVTIVQGLEDLEIRAWVETKKTTALLRSARILKRSLKTWEIFLSLRRQWKISAKLVLKKLRRKKILADTAVPVDQRVKLKEREKGNTFVDLLDKFLKKIYGTWRWRGY